MPSAHAHADGSVILILQPVASAAALKLGSVSKSCGIADTPADDLRLDVLQVFVVQRANDEGERAVVGDDVDDPALGALDDAVHTRVRLELLAERVDVRVR